MSEFTEIDTKVKDEICKMFHKLGASIELLAVVGSWHDTQDSDDILVMLKKLNSDASIWDSIICGRKEINPREN